jgi:hypothetical protein
VLGRGPEDSDTTSDRVAAFGSGLVYAGLSVVAAEILLGAGGGSSENAHKTGSAFSATSLAQSGRSRQLARREDYDVVDVGNERSTEGR